MNRRNVFSPGHERAAALVIVLAFVVLVTALVVASMSRTQTDRSVSHGSFNQSMADQLAASAAEIVISDLRQEIVDGSGAPVTVGTTSVYRPTSNANMLPRRSGNPALVAGVDPIPNLVRVSVRSDSIVSPPGVSSRASAVNSTTDSSSNGRSISLVRWNSHYLIPRHDLSSTAIDSTPLSPVAPPIGPGDTTGFTPPDWVILTRSGPAEFAAWDPSLANNTADNYAIGRYAFAVYDQGGLLDVNVAGYPYPSTGSSSYATDIGRKGVLAFADLSALVVSSSSTLGTGPVHSIVGWRNFATTQQTGSNFPNFSFTSTTTDLYDQHVINNTNGFVKASATTWTKPGSNPNTRTDQMFLSRQQLLNFRRSADFTQNALRYFSTFSREVNSPSLAPATPTAVNPDFPTIMATAAFSRFDGTTAVIGEPLVKRRFPLNRLAWLTYKGPSAVVYAANSSDAAIAQLTAAGVSVTTIQAGTAENIKKCFGLVWDSRAYVAATATAPSVGQQWVYISPSPANTGGSFDPVTSTSGNPSSAIKTLITVVLEGREPDFFELLRAAILDGSIGQDTGGGVTGGTTVFPDVHMADKTHHILSIGAAVIDQADPDSLPTRIQMRPDTNWWTAYGVESLPYLTQIYPIGGFSPATGNVTKWATYLLFQLSNPHTGATLSPAAPQVRLRVDGSLGIFTSGNGETFATATTPQTVTLPASGRSIPLTVGVLSPPTSTPAPLTTTLATGPAVGSAAAPADFEVLPPNVTGTAISNYIGLRLLPDYTLTGAISGSNNPRLTVYLGTSSANAFNATMEFDAGGGTWVAYNHYIGINDRTSWINGATLAVRTANNLLGIPSITIDQFNTGRLTQSPPYSLMKADPRSTRFGIFQIDTNMTSGARITNTLWPTSQTSVENGYGGAAADGTPAVPGNPLEHVPLRFASAPYYPATFCINDGETNSVRNTVTTSYADGDGVTRPGDAVYPDPATTTTGSSTPFSNVNYRPILLNRPFRNVGELGYAFRDLPWKSVDMFTDKSADAGLLDVFSVVDEPAVVAGHVNLNTRASAVLHTILAGMLWDELGTATVSKTTSTTPPAADSAQTMAPIVVALTSDPASTAPLAHRGQIVGKTDFPLQVLPLPTTNQLNQLLKHRRETIPRALASVSQTRTWNLMIDVIAQSGRYGPNAGTAPNAANPLANFVVQGEQRYWVHVAIDRFTGEVIDKQIEVVNE